MEFEVSIERNGESVHAGSVLGNTDSDAQFRYAASYLEDPKAAPISLSLPLRAGFFTPMQTRSFFEGLLPEGFTRRAVAAHLHLNEQDYVQILHRLGRECTGALRVHLKDEFPEARYEKLTFGQIRQLAAEGAYESAALITGSRQSLPGAMGKIGLYRDMETGEWYLPHGTAPSTHIVKQSHVRLKQIVPNELLCLTAAKYCGIDVPESFIIDLGSGEDADILLASGRFDRRYPEHPKMVNGLRVPFRLHQEDFAQAMGIPSEQKYESGDRHLAKLFALLRSHSARPVEDQLKLWDRIVFHYLIGNTDGHLKNYSLLYAPDLKSARLAPAYDIVHITGYPRMTHGMAFSIGTAKQIEEVTRESFRIAAREAGIGQAMAMDRLDDMSERFCPALDRAASELENRGVKGMEELRESILKTGGIAFLEDIPVQHTKNRPGDMER